MMSAKMEQEQAAVRSCSSYHSHWLLIAENLTRILVSALALLIPLEMKDCWSKAWLAVYIVGRPVYFASWLPLLFAPGSAWTNSHPGLLAPRLTPYLSFLGIALIGGSRWYELVSAVFIIFHTRHGIQNL
jgi:hypothetical protein